MPKKPVAAVGGGAIIAGASFGSCGECGLMLSGWRPPDVNHALVVRPAHHIPQVPLECVPCGAANEDGGELAGSWLPSSR